MNEIQRYRPAFFEGFLSETVPFDTVPRLLEIPWVAHFKSRPDFHQFSIYGTALMAEYKDGSEWWVVGYLKNPYIRLPKWKPRELPQF